MKKLTKEKFVTRPRLAYFLFENGCFGKRVRNVYDDSRPAWLFEDNDNLQRLISLFFEKEADK